MPHLSRYGWVLVIASLSGVILLAVGIYKVAKPIPLVDQSRKTVTPPVPDKTDDLRSDLNRVVSLERCNMNDLHRAGGDVVIDVNFQSMETIALGKAELAGHRRLLAADLQNVQGASAAGDRLIASANAGSSFDNYRKLQRGVEEIKKRSAAFQENEFALLDTMFAMSESIKKRGYATASDKKRMDGYVSEIRKKVADSESFERTVDAETTEQWVWMDRALGGTAPPDKFFATCPPPMSLVRFDEKTDLRLPVSQGDLDQLLATVQGRWADLSHVDSASLPGP